MKLTFNPPQAWISFINIKQDHRKRVYYFLDNIAKTAEQLVDIWENAIVNDNEEIEIPHDSIKKLVRKYPSNNGPFRNLSQYYKFISSVMGKNFNSEMEPFVFHVSSLLHSRNIAKKTIEQSFKNRTSMVVFDEKNENIDLTSLENIVNTMRVEASALRVKAEVFKTKRE